MSKITERTIFRQVSSYMSSFLSKYPWGSRKGYSTQHCPLFMLEKWKRAADNGKIFGILLTDLSKAFDFLSHELLLAKLHAYGFSISALRLIYSYIANRKQRTKINFELQFLGRNPFWRSSRINIRTSPIQHFSL